LAGKTLVGAKDAVVNLGSTIKNGVGVVFGADGQAVVKELAKGNSHTFIF
jgi:hypothetical protein